MSASELWTEPLSWLQALSFLYSQSAYLTNQEEGLPSLLLNTVVCIAVENNPLPFAVGYISVNNFQEAVSSGVSFLSAVHCRKAV